MRIVFVAVFTPSSTNVSQKRGLENNGCTVEAYDYRARANSLGSLSLRDQELIDLVRHQRPELVIFSKCNNMHYRVVEEINQVCPTVLWYMDPLDGNFNNELIQKASRCSYVFCALWDSYIACSRINPKCYFLEEGFDEASNFPVDTLPIHDISFIGKLKNQRIAYHQHLKFKVIDNAYGKDHSVAVGQSKINLNFTEGGTSDRSYKILASKGFLLTEPWPHMGDLFTPGEDLAIFSDIKELKDQITFYLQNPKERERIAQNGFNTVQRFSRANWAQKIISIIKDG